MHFRLVPKSSTLDDLEPPKRYLMKKKCVLTEAVNYFSYS